MASSKRAAQKVVSAERRALQEERPSLFDRSPHLVHRSAPRHTIEPTKGTRGAAMRRELKSY